LLPVLLTLVATLSPVSTTLAALVANMPLLVSLMPVANLPPVQLTLKYLREFSKIFEMTLTLLSEAWGKMNHQKNQKQKIS
jgi:hypothetical protein